MSSFSISRINRLGILLNAATLMLVSTLGLAEPRTVDTAYGPVSVDGTPERIVTLYEGALDAAIAAGAQPLGAVATRGGTSVADYIAPLAGDINIVGSSRETNLEAVIALQPDLILASNRITEQQYRLLSGIAPTIVPDIPAFRPDTWVRETRLFARALNREHQANEAIRRVQARINDIAAEVQEHIPTTERQTSVVRWMPQGAIVMSPETFSATLVSAVGFTVDGAGLVKEDRPHSDPLSQENLSMIDQPWLFLATLNADGQEALAAARQSPAFERLQALGNDRVVTVDGQIWTSTSGPIAAGFILDDIAAALNVTTGQ